MRTTNKIAQFTPAQRDLIRKFLSRKADKKDVKRFDETFYAINKVNTLRKKNDEGLSKGGRSSRRKKIRFYQNKIAQAAKQAAIERNSYLVQFLFRYLRRYGFPKNTSHLLRRMEEKKGLLDVKNAEGEVRTLNRRTVRLMIEDMRRPFSWPKPRRRRATTNRKSAPQHRHVLKRGRPSLPKLKFLEAPLNSAPELPTGRRDLSVDL